MSRSRLYNSQGALAFVTVWSIGVCIPAFIFDVPYTLPLMFYGVIVAGTGDIAAHYVEYLKEKNNTTIIKQDNRSI